LTFNIPTPICGRAYIVDVVECDADGDEDLRETVATGPEATTERIPDGCVIVASAELSAGIK
jgi:hypothetical protein